MTVTVAVDIGGTFTDLVAYDYDGQTVVYTKASTTYDNFVDGILDCFRKARIDPERVGFVNHGTTLVINSLIQRKGAKAALITTRGFRDVLEIARGNRPDPFDLHYRRDPPLIPRQLRFEVEERTSFEGEVLIPLDMDGLERLADTLKAQCVEAIAVFFMNSYANPEHEELAARRLRELLPHVYVTCSTELTREWYEFERTSTAAANAYVGPQVDTYIRRLEKDLRGNGFPGTLYMMGSNGGLLSVDRTCRQPIGLVESGPIGGCIGAGVYAEALGIKNVIAFDMGGTTAKCALVENGRFSVEFDLLCRRLCEWLSDPFAGDRHCRGRVRRRLHCKARHARPAVGRSAERRFDAGAGVLRPRRHRAHRDRRQSRAWPSQSRKFLGGEAKLDVRAAEEAIDSIAAPFGYKGADRIERMAEGVLSISTVIMAGAIKKISVQHGLDPRDFVLFCYGGGGPLHAGSLARELSIPTIIVPPEPGNFSAVGMLLADARLDLSKTFVGTLDESHLESMAGLFEEMEQESRAVLQKEFEAKDVFFERHAEMRYVGQRHNIKVPISGLRDAAGIREAFDRDYKRRYGHADPRARVEFQALHLSAFSTMRRPALDRLPRVAASTDIKTASRRVHFGDDLGSVESKVYDRDVLPVGFRAVGPAVIEEYGSTTIVWPGDTFEIGPLHEIRITCANGSNR